MNVNGHAPHGAAFLEQFETFCAGRVLQLNNFRELRGFGWPKFSKLKGRSQDKGHREEIGRVVQAVREGHPSPIPFEELIEVSRTTINLAKPR